MSAPKSYYIPESWLRFDAHEPHGLGSRFRDDYLASLVNCRRVGAAQPVAVDVLQNTSGAKAKVLRELAKIDVLLDFPICA